MNYDQTKSFPKHGKRELGFDFGQLTNKFSGNHDLQKG